MARDLRSDFVETLASLVDGVQGAGRALRFLIVPNHIARRLRTTGDALKLHRRIRAHFMLYGRARLRCFAGKEHWFLDLSGTVVHARIPSDVGLRFAREFRSLLPKRVQIERDIDVLAFEFTSQAVALVAHYVIGIAAALSGDLAYAEELFSKVQANLPADLRLPVHAKLAKAVPRQLAAVATARAGSFYVRWLKSHDADALASMGWNLDRVGEEARGSGEYVLLKAAWLFVTARQTAEALRVLRAHPHGEAPAWVLSTAFLLAYTGDVRGAVRLYRSLRRIDTPVQTATEVEEFLYWLETEEPENCLVNLCLGYFSWYIKGDSILARAEFDKFLRKRPHGHYVREAEHFTRILSSPD